MDHGKSVHQSPGMNVEGETSRDVTGQNGSNKPTRIADCNQTRHQHKDGSDNGSNTENAESSVMNAVRLANYLYPPEEVVDENRERQRSVHNAVERRRKNKINTGIMRIGSLIPTLDTNKVQGKNQILEHAADYIVELQQKYDNLLLEGATDGQAKEINSLKAENERLRKENQHFSKVLRNVKVSAEGVPQLFTDPLDESRATANESMDEGTQEVTSSNQGPGSAEAANQEAAQSPASNDSTESEQGDNPLENGDKVFTSQESADMAVAQTQGVASVMSSQAVTGLQTVQTVNQNMVVGASATQPVPAATLARKPGEVMQNPVQVAVSNQNQVCNYIAPVQMLGGTPGLQVAASNPLSNVVSYNPSLMSAPGQNVILPQGGGGQVILQQHPGQNQVATYVMPMVQQANQSVAVAQPANQGIALIQQNNQGMTVMQPANQVAVTTVTQSINLTTPIMSTSNQTSGVVTSAIPNQRDVRRSSTDCVKLPNSGQKNQNPSTKKSSKPKSKSSKKSGDSNNRPIASTPQPTASVHVPAGASSVTVPSQPTCLTTQAVSQMQTKVAQATNQSLVVLQQPNQGTQLMVQNPFAQSAVQVMTPHGPVTVPLVNNSIPMQVANHGIQPGHTQIIQTVLPGQVSPAVASQAPNPGQVLQSGNQTPQYIVTQNRVLQVVNPPTALPQQPKQVLINSNGQLILANSPQTFSNHIQVSQPHTLVAAPSSQAPTSQAIPAVQASQAQSLIPAVSSQTSNGQIISTIHMSTAASTVASKVQQLNSQAVNTQQLHVSTTVCSSAATAPSITATIGTAAQHTNSPKDILARAAESIFASSVVPDCSPPLNVSPLKVNSSGAQASVATRVLPAPAVSCSAPKSTLPLIYPSTAIAQVTAPAKPKRRRSRPQKKKTVTASTAQRL
ncbi:basic helix-loop-helix domain-containing protein USF3-like [Ptychodera flava]|uniref:basic helix-loop-helix domain-containing protein USF3-like n=1 Tax=Ptychodera flava TaxID=63121 RepID=UPI00396A714C